MREIAAARGHPVPPQTYGGQSGVLQVYLKQEQRTRRVAVVSPRRLQHGVARRHVQEAVSFVERRPCVKTASASNVQLCAGHDPKGRRICWWRRLHTGLRRLRGGRRATHNVSLPDRDTRLELIDNTGNRGHRRFAVRCRDEQQQACVANGNSPSAVRQLDPPQETTAERLRLLAHAPHFDKRHRSIGLVLERLDDGTACVHNSVRARCANKARKGARAAINAAQKGSKASRDVDRLRRQRNSELQPSSLSRRSREGSLQLPPRPTAAGAPPRP